MKELFLSLENKVDDALGKMNRHRTEVAEEFVAVKHSVTDNTSKITKLEDDMVAVKIQLQNIQRLNNLFCLNVSGVPQNKQPGYDIMVINNIAQHYGVQLDTKAIQFCRRMGVNQAKGISTIFVRFSSTHIVESILDKYFGDTDRLTLANITDESVNSRVYIGEHLTSFAMTLYRECLRLKKQNVITKVYTRRGHVFATTAGSGSNTKSTKIESLSSLRKLTTNAVAKSGSAMVHGANTAASSGTGTAVDSSVAGTATSQLLRDSTQDGSQSDLSLAIGQLF